MRVIKPGHRYILANFEQPENGQTIQFIEKEPDPSEPAKLYTVSDGTTNEEMLAVLIDRANHLQNKMPCQENTDAIEHLRSALAAWESRTAKRKARGVEGTHQA